MQKFNESQFHITSLYKLLQIIDQRHSPTTEDSKQWIFRGQDNYIHELLPAIGRNYIRSSGNQLIDLLHREQQIFKQFKIQTYHEMGARNDFMALSVAQHHGLKTRLLDWSFSPLVALFFAVENMNQHEHHGSFFAFKMNEPLVNVLNLDCKDVFNPLLHYNYLFVPYLSPRIKAQNGLFQLFKHPNMPLESGVNLEKFVIPAKCKSNIKAELFQMGITHSSLFPDMDGVTKSLNYQFFD